MLTKDNIDETFNDILTGRVKGQDLIINYVRTAYDWATAHQLEGEKRLKYIIIQLNNILQDEINKKFREALSTTARKVGVADL